LTSSLTAAVTRSAGHANTSPSSTGSTGRAPTTTTAKHPTASALNARSNAGIAADWLSGSALERTAISIQNGDPPAADQVACARSVDRPGRSICASCVPSARANGPNGSSA